MPTNGIGYLNNSLQGFLGRKHQAGMLESQQAQQQSMHEDSQAESALVREENRDLTMKGWERADVREKQSLAQQLTLAKAHMQQQQQQDAVRQREKMIEQAVELAKASDTNTRFSSEGALNRESEEKRSREANAAHVRAAYAGRGNKEPDLTKDPVYKQLFHAAQAAAAEHRKVSDTTGELVSPEVIQAAKDIYAKANDDLNYYATFREQKAPPTRVGAPPPPPQGAGVKGSISQPVTPRQRKVIPETTLGPP